MKVLSLESELDYDFKLIGVCCHMKDYRLCWEVNRSLSISLKREENYTLYSKDSTERTFPFFEFEDKENGVDYYLMKNRGTSGMIIPEEGRADYLLLLKGKVEKDLMTTICKKLQKVDVILTVYPIIVDSLKSKNNLIF